MFQTKKKKKIIKNGHLNWYMLYLPSIYYVLLYRSRSDLIGRIYVNFYIFYVLAFSNEIDFKNKLVNKILWLQDGLKKTIVFSLKQGRKLRE